MFELWFPISGIPAEGRRFEIGEDAVFLDLIGEYGLNYEVTKPLRAEFFVLPQEDGCFVRGEIEGEVNLPCNRCAENAVVNINHSFESFEPFPPVITKADDSGKNKNTGKARNEPVEDEFDGDVDEEVIRYNPKLKGMEINLAALAWEEFVLSLPIKPLCDQKCKGLCAQCGQNLNLESCACRAEKGDPRLESLRSLQINKK